ncbi:MAG: DUF488 family protein [Bacillati bacterium ANGP1]|uniref:DUF488 family protein n=1 Tax=Candidatus Segetimicrobium genomatis TaxID=2569760 RepID=A0A537K3K5_9BACT|nr:MAG: DUF488 family protein [Terrabacteria group bacterium ANGP1]
MAVRLKRAYDPPSSGDGPRVLVDRVWPRGVSKEKLRIAAWLGDLGPSTGLRKWFAHDPAKWTEFRQRYLGELAVKRRLLDELAGYARDGTLTLVYGARDPAHNQAVVIREALERMIQSTGRRSRSAGSGRRRRHQQASAS